jgi:dihydroxyacetone kinase-like protein
VESAAVFHRGGIWVGSAADGAAAETYDNTHYRKVKTMKALINDPRDVVEEALEGLCRANADIITLHRDPLWVGRAQPRTSGVAVISGGGSGHEPLHTGLVGNGMLDAAVPGAVFTSPSPDAILAAIAGTDTGDGVLCIVKNYTGDVLNFDMARELAEADGHTVHSVLVADDVAVEDSTFTAGRRGVAGTLFVEKIAGAVAASGGELKEVTAAAEEAAREVRSMALALGGCTVPHVGKPGFELSADEVELGIGIHGEPGAARIAMASADELTDRLVSAIAQDLRLVAGEGVLVLVNGMGATPAYQLDIVFRRVAQQLDALDVRIERTLVGNYVTSLDMQGVSVTLARATDAMLAGWDAPVWTAALRKGY